MFRGMKRLAGFGISMALCTSMALAQDKAPEKPLPECVSVEAFARYGAYGYDHVVTVNNDCDKTAQCEVSTDVAPEVIALTVRAHASESVVTYRGSPAYEFSAKVRCRLVD